jgi:hypothetical protein
MTPGLQASATARRPVTADDYLSNFAMVEGRLSGAGARHFPLRSAL